MGGPGSGGERSGTPGKAYTNRSDLNARRLPITTGRGQPYGTATAQSQAQQAVPMARPGLTTPGTPPEAAAAVPRASVPLDAPTSRPDEPVTSGLPIGSGAGPESLFAPMTDSTSLEIRALYQLFPNNYLLSLIEELDEGRTY